MAARKVVQIAAFGNLLFALADDGSIWSFDIIEGYWCQTRGLPEAPDAPRCGGSNIDRWGNKRVCQRAVGHDGPHTDLAREW
jgi:hypothetical protein